MEEASVVPQAALDRVPSAPRMLARAPEELTRGRLYRLGEGIGKVVYASEHWVVRRVRSPSEVVALIVLWKILRRFERILPVGVGARLLKRPSKQIRFLRVLVQAAMRVLPRSIWFTTHIRQVWSVYHRRNIRGERLAQKHLTGSTLVPERVAFPPTRVEVRGWPGFLVVSEATERAEATLYHRLVGLADAGQFDELECWLDKFLELRQSGWRRGLFSVDPHLKNFGIIGDRIVLLDTGGLTNRWAEVERTLEFEEVVAQPHIQLGLGPVLGGRPDIADRFDRRWKSVVSRAGVRMHWPA